MNNKKCLVFIFLAFLLVNIGWAGTELTVGNGAEPVSLDPHLLRGTSEAQIMKELFEGLVVYEQGVVRPGSASSWKILDSGLRYRFDLRDGLKWSDGSPLTAEDYVYSFRRAIDPATASAYSWYFSTATIKNADSILAGKQSPEQLGVAAIDAKTLEIQLEKPVSYFLKLIDFPIFLPVPRQAVEKHGKHWAKPGKMISNGAYQLTDWKLNERVVIKRNQYYYNDSETRIDQVAYLPISDQNAEMNRYLAGEIDITLGIPQTYYEKLKKERPDELLDTPRLALNMLMFNVRNFPVQDAAIRKALSYSIDRSKLTLLDPSGHTMPLYGLTPPIVSGGCYELPLYGGWSQDKREEEAKKLYQKAGYTAGNPLRITLLSGSKLNNDKRASVLAYMWNQVLGVQVTIEKNEWGTYVDRVLSGDFQVVIAPWLGAYNDQSAFMELMVSNFQSNMAGYNNPGYDDLVSQARVARTLVQRQALYKQASQLLHKDMPVAPLHTVGALRLVSSRVKNFPRQSLSGFFFSRQLELKQSEKTGEK